MTQADVKLIIENAHEWCCARLYCKKCGHDSKHMAYKVRDVTDRVLAMTGFSAFLERIGIDSNETVGESPLMQVYVIYCQVCVETRVTMKKGGEMVQNVCGRLDVNVCHHKDWNALMVHLSTGEDFEIKFQGDDEDELWNPDDWFI